MKKMYSWKEGHLNWAPSAVMNNLLKLFERNLDENEHTIPRLNQLLSYVWFLSLSIWFPFSKHVLRTFAS